MKLLKSFILKESKEELRTFVVNFLALACMCLVQQFVILRGFNELFNSIGNNNIMFINEMLNISFVGLSIISITFMSNSTMLRSIQKEKKNKSIIILISLGLKPRKIWFSKTIFSFISGYISYVLILILDILLIKFMFKFPFIISVKTIIYLFCVGPIIAFLLVLILSFLFWYLNNSSFITLIYTMIITFGTWIMISMLSSPINIKSISISVIAVILVTLFLYYVFSKIINNQEKWKLGLN